MSSYRISQLAERCGLPASTLRFYESAGLLPAERTASGYRVYDDDALQRLAFIASAKQLGLPLEEIRELLQVWVDGECGTVRAELLPLLQAQIGEADRRIAELSAFSAHLADVHRQLSGPAPAGACAPGCGCISSSDPTSPTGSPAESQTGSRPETWRSQQVACTLAGSLMTARVQDWQHVLARATSREPIDDGVRLTFPAEPGLALEVTGLAAAEHDCCAFLDFTVQLSPVTVVLSVRTPDAGRDLLAELFGATALSQTRQIAPSGGNQA